MSIRPDRPIGEGDRPAATARGDPPGQGPPAPPGAPRAVRDLVADRGPRLYTPDDIAGLDEDRDLGYPGEPPYTRGVQPKMYRGRLWTMRQYAGFASAEETNARFRYLLERGQTGLSVAFDLPTQMGYDSDDPAAEGEVGRVGVPSRTLADMEVLLDGMPLDEVSDLDDDQRHRADPAGAVRGGGRGAGGRGARSAGRSRTTSSRSTSPAGRTSTRRGRRCGW